MGRAFVYGDNVDTDALAPGRYMKLPADELARHCLESLDCNFANSVLPGDFLVAGKSFGIGSSREQAVVSLKLLGISAILAKSVGRIFYRNAYNLGLPVIVLPQSDEINAGDELRVNLLAGAVVNITQARSYSFAPLPPHLMELIQDGGLMQHLKRKLSVRDSRQGEPK